MEKMLERAEEVSLARAWLEEGSQVARARLLQAYQPLIRNIARKHLRSGLFIEDLVQEGSLGFLSALDNFNPDLGYKVGTLARFHIASRIQIYISEFTGVIRLPDSKRIKTLLSSCVSQIRYETARQSEPLTTEQKTKICEQAGFTLKELEQYEMAMRPPRIIADRNSGDENESSFDLSDPDADIEQNVISNDTVEQIQQILSQVLQTLPKRTRQILTMRHLSDEFMSLDKIAQKIGVSRERVRIIERSALKIIKEELQKRGIENFDDIL